MLLFFFNDTATTEIYTLSLHDALPISRTARFTNRIPRLAFSTRLSGSTSRVTSIRVRRSDSSWKVTTPLWAKPSRSEEHTSELQSRQYLVCRLLLETQNLPARHSPRQH